MKKFSALALIPLLACAAGSDNSSGGLGGGGSGSSGALGSGGSGGGISSTPLATGLAITDIAVFQAVKASIVTAGAAVTPNAPVVAGRAAVVRVYVTPGSTWSSHSVNGVLTLNTGGQDHTFTSALAPTTASTDALWTSTFNFAVDAASLAPDTTFAVRIEDPTNTTSGDATAQFPPTGTPASLGAQTSGVVKISLFPIQFTGGSGSMPATDATDVAAYQATVMGMYPASGVEITVQPALDYPGPIPQPNGQGWDQLLNMMIMKRSGDPSLDVYYYGAFAPAPSFNSFCGGGCVAGLSSIPTSPHDQGQKASIGLVYGGDTFDQHSSGVTMAHEVGHGHGRKHSPTTQSIQGCSLPSDVDPKYPYPQGEIGVFGFDVTSMRPFAPNLFFDLMGYCERTWISDFTYQAFFQWMTVDNGAEYVEAKAPTTYRQLLVSGDGALTVGKAFPVYGSLSGDPHEVTYEEGGVTRTVIGHYYPYDHIPGGYVMAPEPARFTAVRIPDFGARAFAH